MGSSRGGKRIFLPDMNVQGKLMRLRFFLALAFSTASAFAQQVSHTLPFAPGKSITLSLPAKFDIAIAATGIKRARFFAQSPDGRIFVTSMYNLADNTRGALYILDGWNTRTRTFSHVIPYLQRLRNPNNVAFYTDETHQTWLYLPLTDKLVRYKYNAGDNAPSGPAQVLLRFPDYGLNYKYGGWHLTRTVAVAALHGRTRIYVTTGSSCNYCLEREAVRASLTVMDPDGRHQQLVAHGLRNAVDLRYVPNLDGGALFATNMGDDHLGDQVPEDTFFELDSNTYPGPIAAAAAPNYGWPTCYFAHGKPVHDETALPENQGPNNPANALKPVGAEAGQKTGSDSVYGKQHGVADAGTNLAAQVHSSENQSNFGAVPTPLGNCRDVPAAYTTFTAHSSPLGLAYFGADNVALGNSFLVALHGAGHPRIGTGYRVVHFSPENRKPEDFITGFLGTTAGHAVAHGRPCGLLRVGPDTFLLSDDSLGLVYFIFPKR